MVAICFTLLEEILFLYLGNGRSLIFPSLRKVWFSLHNFSFNICRKLIVVESSAIQRTGMYSACPRVISCNRSNHGLIDLVVPSRSFKLPVGLGIGNKRKDYSERRLLG